MLDFDGAEKDVPIIVCGLLLAISVVGVAPSGAAVKEFSNDSFAGAGTATCVTGPAEGLSAAAKLTADPGDYPYQVKKVRMLICPEPTSGFAILRIYEDNTGTVVPDIRSCLQQTP